MKRLKLILSIIALFAVLVGLRGIAPAEANNVITVTTTADVINDNDNQCSLREAIIKANTNGISKVGECAKGSSVSTDVIQLQGGQTYALTLAGAGEDNAGTGDLDILDNPTPDVDVRIEAVGGTAVVQINGTDRVWHIHAAGFEMANVQTSGGSASLGGGLYNEGGVVKLENSSFSLNTAATGGAIRSTGSGSQLRLTAVEISRNLATVTGGGIANQGSLMILIDSNITGNSAAGDGGGITNSNASATLNRTRIAGNESGGCGGGLHNGGTSATSLIDSEVTGTNSADGPGGGICNEATIALTLGSLVSTNRASDGGGGVYNSGTLSVIKSTIQANEALNTDMDGNGFGGGIYSTAGSSTTINQSAIILNEAANGGGGLTVDGTLLAFNSTISDNFGTITGGLLVLANGSGSLFNVTLADNEANIGGLVGSGVHVLDGSITFGNSIVANTTQALATCATAGGGVINSVGNNIGDDNSCFTPLDDLPATDPQLAPLADGLRVPLPGSPAVDNGDLNMCTESAVASVDQLGQSRPVFDGCDIGAVEWQGVKNFLPMLSR